MTDENETVNTVKTLASLLLGDWSLQQKRKECNLEIQTRLCERMFELGFASKYTA